MPHLCGTQEGQMTRIKAEAKRPEMIKKSKNSPELDPL